MEVLGVVAIGVLNLLCFMAGAKVATSKEITLPAVKNPAEAIQEHREKRASQRQQERMETILQNIDRYDGTGIGQQEVPGKG